MHPHPAFQSAFLPSIPRHLSHTPSQQPIQFTHFPHTLHPLPPLHPLPSIAVQPLCLSSTELAGAVRTSSLALSKLDLKSLASWAAFALTLYLIRSFFPVILGTFIVGYVANSVVAWAAKVTKSRAPRRAVVALFYTIIVSAISAFSLMTIPTVVRESQYFITTLQSENPYVYIANSMRKALGDELTTKLETYVMYSIQMPEAAAKGMLPASTEPVVVAPSLAGRSPPRVQTPEEETEWSEARSRRFGMLLQKSIRTYVASTISLITKVLGASTKLIFKALLSLLFSFMIMWDLPTIGAGVRRLRTSRLSFMYEELAPVVTNFASVLGKSFEAQGLIALVNTSLTVAGLIVLGIPGVGFLSVVTLLCSFIPVAGVFISTLPMFIIGLSEYGVAKAMGVIAMVILVHLVEAYVLNPQIYSAHLHLHPFMVLVVLYIAEHSYGIPGLLMAVPVSVYLLRTIMRDEGDAPRLEDAEATPVLARSDST